MYIIGCFRWHTELSASGLPKPMFSRVSDMYIYIKRAKSLNQVFNLIKIHVFFHYFLC